MKGMEDMKLSYHHEVHEGHETIFHHEGHEGMKLI
jgi:hypothetical protein